ncbi:MAG: nuclear transport factor 2 family protein [Gammaproteobacteria bacterium]|nr:nuclear transport factor 2 family protein [Gammaproteobacteria bacterium]
MTKNLEQRVQALEDREAVIKLKARYVNINDGGWEGPTHTDPNAIAQMFTEDGVWDGLPHVAYAEGLEQIRELFHKFVAAANAPYDSRWGKQQFMPVAGGSASAGRYEDILNR